MPIRVIANARYGRSVVRSAPIPIRATVRAPSESRNGGEGVSVTVCVGEGRKRGAHGSRINRFSTVTAYARDTYNTAVVMIRSNKYQDMQ